MLSNTSPEKFNQDENFFGKSVNCQAFYCCIEESTLDLLNVVSCLDMLIWNIQEEVFADHQQHYCDLSSRTQVCAVV